MSETLLNQLVIGAYLFLGATALYGILVLVGMCINARKRKQS